MIDRNLLNTLFKTEIERKKWARLTQEEPTPETPIISKSDIDRKYVDRYFVRPVNDKTSIVEIDQIQYQKFKENPRFTTAHLKWRIIGKKETETTSNGIINRGVADHNRELVLKADQSFGGLTRYIFNYTEYWVADDAVIKNIGVQEKTPT